MGNCVLCFMVYSQMLCHVSIFDASVGFNELQICNHIRHIESELGNFSHTILFPHNLQSSKRSNKQSSKQPTINSLTNNRFDFDSMYLHKQSHHNQSLHQTVLQMSPNVEPIKSVDPEKH